MRPIHESYNVGYNIVLDIFSFNSQIRFGNILNERCQHVHLYKSRRAGLYEEPTGFPNFKNGPQVQ